VSVPARRSYKVIIATGKGEQSLKTGAEIVQDINSAIQKEAAIAARVLSSRDTIVTFNKPKSKIK